MNKQELQKKYQEIVLNTNGGNEDYVVALCQIANAINELDESKQDTKWQQLKEWLNKCCNLKEKNTYMSFETTILIVKNKMQELEGE